MLAQANVKKRLVVNLPQTWAVIKGQHRLLRVNGLVAEEGLEPPTRGL